MLCGEECHPHHSCRNKGMAAQPPPRSQQPEAAASSSACFPDGLAEPPPLDASLVGKTIMFNHDGVGWCQGVVMEENDDEDELDDEDIANFIVYYEVDDSEVAHYLHEDDYMATRDAPAGAWFVCIERE